MNGLPLFKQILKKDKTVKMLEKIENLSRSTTTQCYWTTVDVF